ncbi:MAG: hypothetical protein U1E17_14150 [Geminicoccaceae bacterium]
MIERKRRRLGLAFRAWQMRLMAGCCLLPAYAAMSPAGAVGVQCPDDTTCRLLEVGSVYACGPGSPAGYVRQCVNLLVCFEPYPNDPRCTQDPPQGQIGWQGQLLGATAPSGQMAPFGWCQPNQSCIPPKRSILNQPLPNQERRKRDCAGISDAANTVKRARNIINYLSLLKLAAGIKAVKYGSIPGTSDKIKQFLIDNSAGLILRLRERGLDFAGALDAIAADPTGDFAFDLMTTLISEGASGAYDPVSLSLNLSLLSADHLLDQVHRHNRCQDFFSRNGDGYWVARAGSLAPLLAADPVDPERRLPLLPVEVPAPAWPAGTAGTAKPAVATQHSLEAASIVAALSFSIAARDAAIARGDADLASFYASYSTTFRALADGALVLTRRDLAAMLADPALAPAFQAKLTAAQLTQARKVLNALQIPTEVEQQLRGLFPRADLRFAPVVARLRAQAAPGAGIAAGQGLRAAFDRLLAQ